MIFISSYVYILDLDVSITIRFSSSYHSWCIIFMFMFLLNVEIMHAMLLLHWFRASHLLLIYSWSRCIHHDMPFLIFLISWRSWRMICFSIDFVPSSPHIRDLDVSIMICTSPTGNILDLVKIMAHDMLLHWFRAIHMMSWVYFVEGTRVIVQISKSFSMAYWYCL